MDREPWNKSSSSWNKLLFLPSLPLKIRSMVAGNPSSLSAMTSWLMTNSTLGSSRSILHLPWTTRLLSPGDWSRWCLRILSRLWLTQPRRRAKRKVFSNWFMMDSQRMISRGIVWSIRKQNDFFLKVFEFLKTKIYFYERVVRLEEEILRYRYFSLLSSCFILLGFPWLKKQFYYMSQYPFNQTKRWQLLDT